MIAQYRVEKHGRRDGRRQGPGVREAAGSATSRRPCAARRSSRSPSPTRTSPRSPTAAGTCAARSSLGSATGAGKKAVEPCCTSSRAPTTPGPTRAPSTPSIVDVATSAGAHNVIARSDSLRDTRAGLQPHGGPPHRRAATPRWSPTPGCPPPSAATCHGPATLPSPSSGSVGADPRTHRSGAQPLAQRRCVAPQRTPSVSQAQAMAEGSRR